MTYLNFPASTIVNTHTCSIWHAPRLRACSITLDHFNVPLWRDGFSLYGFLCAGIGIELYHYLSACIIVVS